MRKLRIGTRTSRLAMAQTELVRDALAKAFPGIETELAEVVTKGDRMLDRPLDSFGGKGVFTRELEEKLLEGEIDLAVHSAKDVPMELPEGLSVCSVLTRGTPWDVVVTRDGGQWGAASGSSMAKDSSPVSPGSGQSEAASESSRVPGNRSPEADRAVGAGRSLGGILPPGSITGTSSLRRELQIRDRYPGTEVEMLRGNVLTRLERLREGRYDAILLAGAGLERLGLEKPEGLTVRYLDDGSFLPAAGQGILAVEYRTGELEEIRKVLCQPETEAAFVAERQYLKALGGSCNAPCAAYCRQEGQSLVMSAMYAPDRKHMVHVEQRVPLEETGNGQHLSGAGGLEESGNGQHLSGAGSPKESGNGQHLSGAGSPEESGNGQLLSRARKLAGLVTEEVLRAIRQKPACPEAVSPRVSLVGAGPGDAGLVTCRGLSCIRRADVILYDNLISGSLLNEARLDAKLVYAGKRSGAHHLSQREISRLLVEEALAGNYVVRLKGGDPLVFGRGSEEAKELERHDISYEIVPGVSSAYSVPAYGGIPVTRRGVASSFHVITGHEGEGKDHPALDFQVLAREEGTLVFLMGLGNLPQIAVNLIACGKEKDTPVAVIQQGTTARQRQVISDLEHIVADVKEAGLGTPAIVVVGEVAAREGLLNWSGRGPLWGTRILLTGTRAMVREQEQVLTPLGAETVAISLVESRPVRSQEQRHALANLGQYQWLVLTSAAGVDQFFGLLRELEMDHRALMHVKFAVVGRKTGEALTAHGFIPDFTPAEFTSRCLADTWVPTLSGETRVLLLRAREGSPVLPEKLKESGISFQDIPLYETWTDTRRKEDLERILPDTDFVTVASASAVRALAGMADRKLLQTARIISIGPETTRAAVQAGLTVAATAEEATAEGMAREVLAAVGAWNRYGNTGTVMIRVW